MKESVTKFNLEAAFKALDEIEIPVARKGIAANKVNLKETFNRKSKLDLLLEDYYDVNDTEELEAAKEAREAEVAKAKLARIEKIVDLNAESEEDLLPSYVGKMIIQCPQCMTLFYKNEEDIARSEEDPEVVNVNEVCQHCGNASGYSVIGKVDQVGEEEAEEYDLDALEDENELDLDFPEGTEEVDPEGTGEDARDDELDLEPVNAEDEEETTEEDSEEAEEEVKESLHEDFDEEFLDEEELEDEEIEETEEVVEEEKVVISAEEVKEIAAEAGEEVAEVVKENPEVEAEEIKEITDEVVDNALEVEDETEEEVTEDEEVIEDTEDEEVVEEALNEAVQNKIAFMDLTGSLAKNAEPLYKTQIEKDGFDGEVRPTTDSSMKDVIEAVSSGAEVILYTCNDDYKYIKKLEGKNNFKVVMISKEDLVEDVAESAFSKVIKTIKRDLINAFEFNVVVEDGEFYEEDGFKDIYIEWEDFDCESEEFEAVVNWIETNENKYEGFKLNLLDEEDVDFITINVYAKEALTEAVDKELDDKLKAHNEYVEYLKDEIEKTEKSLENAKNDFVKKSIQAKLDALKADLEAALPEALKDEVVADELPTPEESGLEDAAENKEEVKESLVESTLVEDEKTVQALQQENKNLEAKLAELETTYKTVLEGERRYNTADEAGKKVLDKLANGDYLKSIAFDLNEYKTKKDNYEHQINVNNEIIKNGGNKLLKQSQVMIGKNGKEIEAESLNETYYACAEIDGEERRFPFNTREEAKNYIDMIQKGEAKEFEGKKIGSTWTEGLKEETKEALTENVIININVEGEKEEAPVIIPVEANVETGCLPEAECPVEPIVEPQPEAVEEPEAAEVHVEEPAEEVEAEEEISEEELEDEEIIEEACEPLTEEDNFDLSDAEAEELFNSDEFKQPISEEEIDGYLDESSTFESVFEEIDELDDESIQNCICESLTEVYSNVENFVMESCEMDNGTFKINGTINFKSGNTTATSYVFNEAKRIDENRIALNGINETLSKDGSFVLEAKVNPANKSMIANTLSYSYKINNNLVEGLIKNNK